MALVFCIFCQNVFLLSPDFDELSNLGGTSHRSGHGLSWSRGEAPVLGAAYMSPRVALVLLMMGYYLTRGKSCWSTWRFWVADSRSEIS